MLNKMFKKSDFAKNVLTLIGGGVFAQAIVVISSPILTRIYSADDFGLFALYSSIVSVFAVAVTGRYELAVMLPKEDRDASSLLSLSLILTLTLSLLSLLIIIFFSDSLEKAIGGSGFSGWLYFIPAGLFLNGVVQTFSYWASRKKDFKSISINRVIHSSISSVTQISLGLIYNGTAAGLLVGITLSMFISSSVLVAYLLKRDQQILTDFSWTELRHNMAKYSDYPKYNTWPSILNSFTLQAPIFFISKSYDMQTVGYVSLALKFLVVPVSLVSSSIGQVYFQRISTIAISEPSQLRKEVLETFKKLTMYSLIVFFPIILWGEEIFSIFLGKNWSVSGSYAEVLCIAVVIRFIVSPLTTVIGVTNHVRYGAVWKIFYFLSTVAVLYFGTSLDFRSYLYLYVLNEAVNYLICLILIFHASSNYKER